MSFLRYIFKAFAKLVFFNIPYVDKLSVSYIIKKRLLPTILTHLDSQELKNIFFLPKSTFSSQINQDFFALLMNDFKPGFFIEIGANDGFNLSNTYYLEKHYDWEGILIEANPAYSENLKNRKAKAVIAAISDEDEIFKFRDAGLYGGLEKTLDNSNPHQIKGKQSIEVQGKRLISILEAFQAPKVIDFISIDVEGGELDVLKQIIKLEDYKFKSGCIEHNYRKEDKNAIKTILIESGFKIAWEGQTKHDFFFYSD